MDIQERLHGVRCRDLDPIDETILARQELEDELAETGPIADELKTTTDAYEDLLSACDEVRDLATKAEAALKRIIAKLAPDGEELDAETNTDVKIINKMIENALELEGG